MLRLVKAELFKLFKNKTFIVLCCVSIFLSAMMILMTSPFIQEMIIESLGDIPIEDKMEAMGEMQNSSNSDSIIKPGQMGIQISTEDPMNPKAEEIFYSSFGAGLTEILIGILIAAFLAKEYSEGTIKNTLAYGRKRSQFYIAKFIAIVIGVTILLAILTLLSTTIVTLMNGWGQEFEISQLSGMLLTFIAAIMANASVASIIMIIATVIKSNGATIGVTAGVFILLPNIVGFMYGVYPLLDKIYELTPYYNTAVATSIHATSGDLMKSIVIALATIVISLLVGINIFKKQDIR